MNTNTTSIEPNRIVKAFKLFTALGNEDVKDMLRSTGFTGEMTESNIKSYLITYALHNSDALDNFIKHMENELKALNNLVENQSICTHLYKDYE